MRKVDKLGRIVIPLELRQKYGLSEGVTIEFLDGGDGITVKPFEFVCKLCHKKISEDSAFPLCEACIAKAAKSLKENGMGVE